MQYWPAKSAPDALDYGLNWAPALSKLNNLVITASRWEVIEGDVGLSLASFTPTVTAVRVSGGEANSEHVVRNIVTLSDNSVFHEDAFIRVLL